MGFAEQLAARAAETHSHNTSVQRRLTPPRPRPGKIIHPQSSSPSLFAEQLKQRRARHENNSLLSENNRPVAIIDDAENDTNSTTNKERPRRRSLVPTATGSPNGGGSIRSLVPRDTYNEDDDEEDEYSSVGFSLMDASTDLSVNQYENYTEHDIENTSQRGRDEGSLGGESKSSSTKQKSRRIRPVGTISDITASPPKREGDAPTKMQQEEEGHVPFNNGTSPISKSRTTTFPRQEQNESELQTILQLQLVKSQSLESQGEEPTPQYESSANTNQANNNTEPNSSIITEDASTSKQIFGAWAQIEQLQTRLKEAEQRAKEESQRAELASYELRLVKEGGNGQGHVQQDQGEQEQQGQLTGGGSHVAEGEQEETGVTDSIPASDDAAQEERDHQQTTTSPSSALGDHQTVLVPTVKKDEGAVTNQATPSTTSQQITISTNDEAIQQWKKRALEAEERLVKEVERLKRAAATQAATSNNPPTHAPPQSSTSHFDEESDLIRLKNAEIDVLRSQIHRLERRIAEECERNEDLIRSSYHNLHTAAVDHLHGDAPPLVVASECMTQSTTRSSELDEFRLLRNEIRHLQYQLRAKSGAVRNGASGGMGTSSTGGSTLSSLDDGHDENDYHNASRDESGDNDDEVVMEEDENGNAVASSSWGLCCFRGRRSRRGYGRASMSDG